MAAIESAGSSYLYSMPARLPIIRRRFSVPKSPHKHRKAIEQFEICERKRIIDVHRRDLLEIAERRGERGPRRWGRMEWPSRSLSTRGRGSESMLHGREEEEEEDIECQLGEEEGEDTREDLDVMKDEEEEEEVDIIEEEQQEEMERPRALDDHSSRERLQTVQEGEWTKVENKKKNKREPPHEATVKALLTIDLPELVHYNLRYEPYRLPLKGREIVARLGYQPKWTSKYFEYLQVRKKHE